MKKVLSILMLISLSFASENAVNILKNSLNALGGSLKEGGKVTCEKIYVILPMRNMKGVFYKNEYLVCGDKIYASSFETKNGKLVRKNGELFSNINAKEFKKDLSKYVILPKEVKRIILVDLTCPHCARLILSLPKEKIGKEIVLIPVITHVENTRATIGLYEKENFDASKISKFIYNYENKDINEKKEILKGLERFYKENSKAKKVDALTRKYNIIGTPAQIKVKESKVIYGE